ncbi:MAG TPA: cytochrome c [Candidatus Angelobacter sp.]|nr:cytochrome c [Candidatus Angelobacter sp.]
MRTSTTLSAALLAMAMLLALGAAAKTNDGKNSTTPASATANSSTAATARANSSTTATSSTQDENLHLEGEKRFRSNCGRCHVAPPKFPSRMMATIVRHMRVRAAITDADMRLILRYMAE